MSKRIGVDIGFFQIKISDLQKDHSFESVVGYGFKSMVDTYFHDGIVFDVPDSASVGPVAIKYAKTRVRGRKEEWLTSKECRIVFQAAMSEIVFTSDEILSVVSIPINFYKLHKGAITKQLAGKHTFTRHGRKEQTLDVKILELPQGFTVICNEMLDNDGQPCDSLALERIACLDIGGKTTNLIVVDSLRDVEHLSTSVDIGCWQMIGELKTQLEIKLGRSNISEYACEEALRTGILRSYGEEKHVEEDVALVKTSFLTQITNAATELWQDIGSIEKIYISGGGSLLYTIENFWRAFPQADFARTPLFANAYGAAKYARRVQ